MVAVLALFVLVAPCSGARLLLHKASSEQNKQLTAPKIGSANETMKVTAHNLVEVTLGPFSNAADACDYCAESFTKEGNPPAGPVAPFCVCMAYPTNGGYNISAPLLRRRLGTSLTRMAAV